MSASPEMLRSRTAKQQSDELINNSDAAEVQGLLASSKSGEKLLNRRMSGASTIEVVWRHLRYRWSLLTTYSKVVVSIALSLVLLHVVFGSMDVFFHSYGFDDRAGTGGQTSYAVVINTYKRPDMLHDAVLHYAAVCGPKAGVSQVFVVWAEQGNTPPDGESFFETGLRHGYQNHSRVEVMQMAKDSLNSRFLPIPQLESDVVFMVDDDVRVDCASLYNGFQAWNSFPDSLVGYYPRLAAKSRSNEQEFMYHNWPSVYLRSRFNIILTKASFMHRKYFDIYSDPLQNPNEILEFVDSKMNCEDVAMAMVVANYTRAKTGEPARPIYVEGHLRDRGLFGGISTGSDHFDTRTMCLTELTKIYRRHGWDDPLSSSVTLKDSTYVHHAPGFWFQHRPSNFFEWLSINVFTIFK